MELFGIVLAIPAAFGGCVIYCLAISKIVIRFNLLRRSMLAASIGVLFLFALEMALLMTLGAVRSRAMIGPGFYVAHLVVFVLGTPALANVLILRSPKRTLQWYWAVPLCTVFALSLVLVQYGVSEALYGVDGTNSPDSRRHSAIPQSGSLLNLDPGLARLLAQRAIRNDGAKIELERE